MSRHSLDHFVTQCRAAIDRGLPVTAEDILDGLEFAIAERRERGPLPFDSASAWIEDRLRLRALSKRTRREVAEAAQQLDLDWTYRGSAKITT